MAGVEDPDVIDLVAHDAEGRCLVVMVETRPWGLDPDQGAQLKAKINAYATWITDGSLLASAPEADGAPVVIRLDCAEPPTGAYAVITVLAARNLGELGIGFEVHVADTAPEN
ncbi:MAG: hypothetical protein GEV08_21970 [Acidimicrobiia bacterium]|nr:hypothetical protein [Acidimicrobiia bacterium]